MTTKGPIISDDNAAFWLGNAFGAIIGWALGDSWWVVVPVGVGGTIYYLWRWCRRHDGVSS